MLKDENQRNYSKLERANLKVRNLRKKIELERSNLRSSQQTVLQLQHEIENLHRGSLLSFIKKFSCIVKRYYNRMTLKG